MLKDLGCIKVVPGVCSDCHFKKPCLGNNYGSFIKDVLKTHSCSALIGMCNIFKMEEMWETCTRENTQAGDIVRGDITGNKFVVKIIHETRDRFLLDNDITMGRMGNFKIKVT